MIMMGRLIIWIRTTITMEYEMITIITNMIRGK